MEGAHHEKRKKSGGSVEFNGVPPHRYTTLNILFNLSKMFQQVEPIQK
jgi:hypothetical protein